MRDLSVVVYGATGFTGRLAAEYLAEHYANLQWGIAGRSEAKLSKLAQELSPDNPPEVIVADAADEEALRALCMRTKVVASTAGPFSRYSAKLVGLCAETGTSFTDITGEVPTFVRENVARYDDVARSTGAWIVSLCGHDSVPWDISTYMLGKALKDRGEELKRVDFYDTIKSQPSGGTMETALGALTGKDKAPRDSPARALGFDPLLRLADGSESRFNLRARNVNTWSFAGTRPRSMFVMAGVNALAVKRSNALNGYGTDVVYCEGTAHKGPVGAVLAFLSMALLGAALLFPPTRLLMQKFVLPKPGEGPTREFMINEGRMTVVGEAVGSGGTKLKATLSIANDPGYYRTASMLIESSLVLALESDKLDVPGGVYTPGACLKELLLNRMLSAGWASFTLEE